MSDDRRGGPPPSWLTRVLQRVVDVREEELRALGWSCVYFFCILSAYYIIRPMRDEMGVASGIENFRWLFTGTLAATLVFHPPFAALVARLSRMRFVSLSYRFFMINLLIFYLLLQGTSGSGNVWVGRVFYVWTSVFNLFIVSIFWAFMADIFHTGQGKRLFGFIGVGGTLGGIVGSGITSFLAVPLGPANLLLGSVLLLELGVLSVRRLSAMAERLRVTQPTAVETDAPIGGSALAGVTHLLRSPYLLGICGYMLLFTITATFVYLEQADIVAQTFDDRATRTAFFARIDLIVNVLTLGTQLFLTGRILKALGVGVTLTLLPVICVFGFLSVGTLPTLAVIVTFQVLRRATNYAVARPTREVLFTVVSREDKYKAKNLIDTFVYRGGDQVGVWSEALMRALGLGMAGIAFTAAPVAAVWVLVGLWLGKEQERKRATSGAEESGAAVAAAS